MSFVPERGDIVWLNFSPQRGHEQKGLRPALVISPRFYNKKTDLALCCPIISEVKGYPFEVIINGKKIKGVILSDQLKNLDWNERQASFIEKADIKVLNECLDKISVLLS